MAAFILLGGLGFLTGLLAACGGGSSSNTGPSAGGGGGFSGGSGAVIQGQLVRGGSAALGESRMMVVLRGALGIGLAEAAAGEPVVGATVELLDASSAVVATTLTTSVGAFTFPGVTGGSYTLRVTDTVPDPDVVVFFNTPIVVGDGDEASIVGTVTQTNVAGTLNVHAGIAADILHNAAQLCHATNIANASGREIGDVVAARQARGGHGWGKIAQDFGVSPSELGKHCTEIQISDAAATLNGGSSNTGTSNNGGNGKGKSKGKGKS